MKFPLDWQATSEQDLVAYSLERGQNGTFTWLQDLGTNGFISATGDINTSAAYLVTDTTAVNGQTYTYRLLAYEGFTPGARTAVIATRTVTLMDIDLVHFTATAADSAARLDWVTTFEVNVGAYRLERGQNSTYHWLQNLGHHGYISAIGGPLDSASYVVTDTTAVNGQTYDYRLIAVLAQPDTVESELAEDQVMLPSNLYLPIIVRP